MTSDDTGSGKVRELEYARRARRERARIGDFAEPDDALDIALPVERTSDGMRRIAVMAPAPGHMGWSLSPDQADDLARYLMQEAEAARRSV